MLNQNEGRVFVLPGNHETAFFDGGIGADITRDYPEQCDKLKQDVTSIIESLPAALCLGKEGTFVLFCHATPTQSLIDSLNKQLKTINFEDDKAYIVIIDSKEKDFLLETFLCDAGNGGVKKGSTFTLPADQPLKAVMKAHDHNKFAVSTVNSRMPGAMRNKLSQSVKLSEHPEKVYIVLTCSGGSSTVKSGGYGIINITGDSSNWTFTPVIVN